MLPLATFTLLGLLALPAGPGPTASALVSPALQKSRAAKSDAPESQTPDRKNFTAWADFIRPNSEELKFESIGWRNQFWPAVQEAKKLGRPILLWTMNGHPLGCT